MKTTVLVFSLLFTSTFSFFLGVTVLDGNGSTIAIAQKDPKDPKDPKEPPPKEPKEPNPRPTDGPSRPS